MRIDFLQRGCKESSEMILSECRYGESALDYDFQVRAEDETLLGEGGRVLGLT